MVKQNYNIVMDQYLGIADYDQNTQSAIQFISSLMGRKLH